jgi:hypothetical protein
MQVINVVNNNSQCVKTTWSYQGTKGITFNIVHGWYCDRSLEKPSCFCTSENILAYMKHFTISYIRLAKNANLKLFKLQCCIITRL